MLVCFGKKKNFKMFFEIEIFGGLYFVKVWRQEDKDLVDEVMFV